MRVERLTQDAPVLRLAGVAGPQGPAGPQGQSAQLDFASQATWIAEHGFGRAPAVQVFLANGEWVAADVVSTAFNLTVTFAGPQTGFVLLN